MDMIIVKYQNVMPYIGYMKIGYAGLVRYQFAELDHEDSGTRKICVEDMIVTDLKLYKAIHKMTGARTELEDLQAYFQYIDMKYPSYSYH